MGRPIPGPASSSRSPNPRVEAEDHYYRAAHTRLLDLGLVPHLVDEQLIVSLAWIVERHQARVNLDAIRPSMRWRSTASVARQG